MNDYWEEEELEETVEQTQPRRAARKRRSDEARGNLYLLTGLILGIGLGLFIAWVIAPVQYVDIDPGALSEVNKVEYRRMIAMAYNADRNLERARERALLVDGDNAVPQLAAQAQQLLAENRPAYEARALAVLAADLARPEDKVLAPSLESTPGTAFPGSAVGESALATEAAAAALAAATTQTAAAPAGEISEAVRTPTSPIPTQTLTPTRTSTTTRTPIPTFTPLRPTATAAGALDAPFVLAERAEVCDGSVPAGLLQIQVGGEDGEPLPGAKVTVNWQDRTEDFYTGLVPENGPGYADFLMQPGITYRVQVGSAGEQADFEVPDCGGGWMVTVVEGKP